jgi:very-short-patch-repair endonuclease
MVTRKPIDLDDLACRHASGQSVLQMSREVGVSRPAIIRRLAKLGLEVRSGSEANRLRMARLSVAERRALAEAANEARRSTRLVPTGQWHARNYGIAQTRQRTLSPATPDEEKLLRLADTLGVQVTRQVAVGAYNLDFRIGSVAVEVHSAAYHPLRLPRLAQRAVNLLSAGWSVAYLWRWGDDGGQNILTWAQQTSRDVPLGGQYRVVRGDGEIVPFSRAELNERADMATTGRALYRLPRPIDLS